MGRAARHMVREAVLKAVEGVWTHSIREMIWCEFDRRWKWFVGRICEIWCRMCPTDDDASQFASCEPPSDLQYRVRICAGQVRTFRKAFRRYGKARTHSV